MRLKFSSSEVVVTRQQHLSYQALEADAIVGADDELDIIPGGYVPAEQPEGSGEAPMDVSATYASTGGDLTLKRKRDDEDSGEESDYSKRARMSANE